MFRALIVLCVATVTLQIMWGAPDPVSVVEHNYEAHAAVPDNAPPPPPYENMNT